MRYIWTEDTGAGLHFWNLVNQILFDNKIVIESKASNQGILDAFRDWLLLSFSALNWIRIMETMFLFFATEKEIS